MLKQRKHKKFNYKSRFSKDDALDVKAGHDSQSDALSEWNKTRRTSSDKRKGINLPVLLILLGIIIAIFYYLETKTG